MAHLVQQCVPNLSATGVGFSVFTTGSLPRLQKMSLTNLGLAMLGSLRALQPSINRDSNNSKSNSDSI